jgi:hypothetical protein
MWRADNIYRRALSYIISLWLLLYIYIHMVKDGYEFDAVNNRGYIESMLKAIRKRNWSKIGNQWFSGDTSGGDITYLYFSSGFGQIEKDFTSFMLSTTQIISSHSNNRTPWYKVF